MSDVLKTIMLVSAVVFGMAVAAILKFSVGLSDLSAAAIGIAIAASEVTILSFIFRRVAMPHKRSDDQAGSGTS